MKNIMTELLEKYDVQGPRYTSYPTVPYWCDNPSEQKWLKFLEDEIEHSREAGSGAALYIHIPFCEKLCTFCACNRIITRKHEQASHYINMVHAEWMLYKKHLGFDKLLLSEIHLGGGTPTFLTPHELEDLLHPILRDVSFTQDSELSFETDPRVTHKAHLEVMASLGFKRISLGIQDYDPQVQRAIHREQSVEMVTDLCAQARDVGFTGINFDLVYGLPHQTETTIQQTIDHVIKQRPDRIAFYAYAHVPWVGKTGQRGFEDSDLPKAQSKRKLYEHGRSLLEAAGYVEVGMDHFALPHDPLFIASSKELLFRNFMGYVPYHVSPLIGLGVSAISDSWTCFTQNEKSLSAYEEKIKRHELPLYRGHVLTSEDLILRRVILDLMTKFKLSWSRLQELDCNIFKSLLQEAENDDLIEMNEEGAFVKEKGKPFIRNICMAFDLRLQRHKPQTQIFSRTI